MARKKKMGHRGILGGAGTIGTAKQGFPHGQLVGGDPQQKQRDIHHAMQPLSLQGHDSMAHPSHHQANVDHGTPDGFTPDTNYKDGGSDHHMGDNVCYED